MSPQHPFVSTSFSQPLTASAVYTALLPEIAPKPRQRRIAAIRKPAFIVVSESWPPASVALKRMLSVRILRRFHSRLLWRRAGGEPCAHKATASLALLAAKAGSAVGTVASVRQCPFGRVTPNCASTHDAPKFASTMFRSRVHDAVAVPSPRVPARSDRTL